jgi:hypothetical protein
MVIMIHSFWLWPFGGYSGFIVEMVIYSGFTLW